GEYEVIIDREKAIKQAIKEAKKDDIIVIAGKGHETYQILGDKTIHFDDREVARQAILEKNSF
ncbi:UDP-N-acetylmuramoyl-L-alanyl-D-glutamate--2,6-diaminopimelate ligase, partial [Desertibacillus haloalkaliphilus]|nr:UDP-N-acetylmuramoyl-L-alanyl-D-glutamate--2,6-diaminopimelate ligase [Desertibacillus haloalkaliphilus]